MAKNEYRWKCEHSKDNKGSSNRCKICRKLEYQKTHPKIVPQTNQDRNLRKTFGLALEQYLQKLAKQNGVCAICKKLETATRLGKTKALAVDHNKKCCPGEKSCGKCVRALLCQKCNIGLGHFDEIPELLITAAQYLKSYE